MTMTLGQAAKAVGKNPSTISRAIRDGRLQAARGNKNAWIIDPEVLFALYPKQEGKIAQDLPQTLQQDPNAIVELTKDNAVLQTKVDLLEKENAFLRELEIKRAGEGPKYRRTWFGMYRKTT